MNKAQMRKTIRMNKCIRFLVKPVMKAKAAIHLRQYSKSEDARYVASLKDIHKGEECFVIGNGPSLTPEDLDTLASKQIICFGSNRIFKIFPKTVWRPTYYYSTDTGVIIHKIENIKKMGDFVKILNYEARRFGRLPEENIHYVCFSDKFMVDPLAQTDTLSPDPSKYVSRNATITVLAIEMAIYMGFQKIYLLGVDNNYMYKMKADGTIYIDPMVKASYFAGGEPDKTVGPSVLAVDQSVANYGKAKRFAEERGVKIYNATRGGKLEVFERVDFDDLMKEKGNK